jgi:cell division protein FtsZ
MAISIEFADDAELQARIKVVGVGGGGGNAINTMIQAGLEGVEFIAANTDTQALALNLAPEKIAIGSGLTRGLGAGAQPEVGRKAALEDVKRIGEALEGANMVFVTAGMGGGTGTGAAPIIAQIARDLGALTVGVVTKPFGFEGKRRMKNALDGIEELAASVDTIITIPNEKLLELSEDDMPMLDAFRRADDVLLQAVRGISDLIVNTGAINVDFADVRTIMSATGRALMGTGYGRGENRALEAAEIAVNSPLLDEISIQGATGILINFTAGPDFKAKEINLAASYVQQAAHEDANIIFGLVVDPNMGDVVKVTVIATGFDLQPASADSPLVRRHSSLPAGQQMPVAAGVRAAAQQALSRSQTAASMRPSSRPESTGVLGDPLRRSVEVARPIRVGSDQRPVAPRAFGASAIHDETTLDIPAYLRRTRP